MRLSVVIASLAVLAVAGAASAQTAPADEAISTAGKSAGNPLTTQQQIEQYLAASRADVSGDAAATEIGSERKIHGEVTLGVGTGGYRSGSVSAVIPLGETGTLALSYGQSKNDYGYRGYGYPDAGYGYGYDSLAAPLTLETDCDLNRRERGRYGDPTVLGRSQASQARCANR